MDEREQLKHALVVIQEQRAFLGDHVADTTLLALQAKLGRLVQRAEARPAERPKQRKQVTILFARVSQFARVAEALPDTDTLNLMNQLWRQLDEAITEQGGIIDKHIGDRVMGIFGAPTVSEDDPERAVRAALAMRTALSDFVRQMSQRVMANGGDELDSLLAQLRNLHMQIGINTGPVLFGEMGTSDEVTVIGDAVNVASRVQDAAPPDGLLIAHDTYVLVRGVFNVEPLGPVSVKGKSEPLPVYLVLGLNPRLFFPVGRGVEGMETSMVGRDEELEQLQSLLQTTAVSRSGSLVTIQGDAGVGKSRLIYEFNSWIRGSIAQGTLPNIAVFRGRTDQQMHLLPYSLIRDLLTSYFEIQDNDSAAIAESKLVQGLYQFMPADLDEGREDALFRTRAIGQLIGLNLADTGRSQMLTDSIPVRERVFDYVVDFFKTMTMTRTAVVFLEDIHWADDGSLDLIAYLAAAAHTMPLLMVCLTRPTLFERRPLWLTETSVHQMELVPLSETYSRRLVRNILRKLSDTPSILTDLIVNTAEGNPFYVEELIKILIEDGIIITGSNTWHLQPTPLTQVRLPPTLNGVLQARLDRLSAPERITLQRAAVIGRIFWDDAVIEMNQSADHPFATEETMIALQVLCKREMVFRRKTSAFAGTQSYIFKHAILRQVAYESVLLRDRPVYHKQVGDWLARQSGERVAEYAGSIAEHYELAGEKTRAAELYEMAALRAEDTFEPAQAIVYYQNVLALLADKPQYLEWHLRVQERLGRLLGHQARFVEAEEAYKTMQTMAKIDGDLMTEGRAWNSLAALYRLQMAYQPMFEAASLAEDVAWLIGSNAELAAALRYRSEAVARRGDYETALLIAERALETSQKLDSVRETIATLQLLIQLYLQMGQAEGVKRSLEQLRWGVRSLAQIEVRGSDLAFAQLVLGEVYNQLERFDQAAEWLEQALVLARELDDQPLVAAALNGLAQMTHWRGQPQTAVPLYREAIAIAEAIGHRHSQLSYITHLAAAQSHLGHYEAAAAALHQVIQVIESETIGGGWLDLPLVYQVLAEAYAGQGMFEKALEVGWQAYALAQRTGSAPLIAAAWLKLGQILATAPADKQLVVQLENGRYSAAICFAEAWRLVQPLPLGVQRLQASLMEAWEAYELAQGNQEQGESLHLKASLLAQQAEIMLKK